ADGPHRNGALRITIACTGVAAARFPLCLHVKSRHLGDAYRYPTEKPYMTSDITPARGPRRFQWSLVGWFGASLGGSCWLAVAAAKLAMNGEPRLAIIPLVSCVAIVALASLLWTRRHSVPPFSAFLALLASFAVVVPTALYIIGCFASERSLAALNWPETSLVPLFAFLGVALVTGQFCILEYSFPARPVDSVDANANGDRGSPGTAHRDPASGGH
ncbi:hypothetical protein, partial [Rubripirellula obstinata]|uniref:hypothetical protein n=1 Tax=Rubripirellula obstinata TaxID=406547 RepID=UPI001EE49F25